jgi:translation initiation factor IF-1
LILKDYFATLIVLPHMDEKENELEEIETMEGRVIEALPSTLFRIETSKGQSLISYLGGRMRVHKIKVLVGDRVVVQIDPYGGKGRIIKRL